MEAAGASNNLLSWASNLTRHKHKRGQQFPHQLITEPVWLVAAISRETAKRKKFLDCIEVYFVIVEIGLWIITVSVPNLIVVWLIMCIQWFHFGFWFHWYQLSHYSVQYVNDTGTNTTRITRKQTLRSLSMSYQKKDGLILLLVWQRQRP